MDTLFISDLHLCEERPEKPTLFKQLLQGPALKARALYILGDLLENFWLGDDDHTRASLDAIAALARFSRDGGRLFLLRGNRELMFSRRIEQMSGGTLLPDSTVIELDGRPVLITHGDLLCTRDVKYQLYRRFLERPGVRRFFLRLPYLLRCVLVRGLRPLMKKSTRRKSPSIVDVDPEAVEAQMRAHGVQELIHGHTHRPGIHEFQLDGAAARRIVLGDWYEKDSILVCRGEQRRLLPLDEYLAEAADA